MNRNRFTIVRSIVLSMVFVFVAVATAYAEDVVELSSGATIRGTVTARTPTEITIQTTIAGQSVVRKFPVDRLRAVTIGGKREALNEQPGAPPPTTAAPTQAAASGDSANRKTREQVLAEIARAGETPPDWFAAAPLVYPPTLDLSWPVPPPKKGWLPQENVGAYFWDVINPNPGRWPQGIKLLHLMLEKNAGKPEVIERIRLQLAHIYFSHFNDYARAAYWYRLAGAENADEFGESAVNLAESYYHLGNKDMAADLLSRISDRNGVVKAWTTLGEFDKALEISRRVVADDPRPLSIMYQGDAYRLAGRYDEALAAYQRVLDLGPPGNNKGLQKQQGRAQASIDAIRLFEKSDVSRVPDGTYTAQSLGYEGQITVEVTVAAKRIVAVRVVKHTEKQFYSALVDTPQRIIAKQSVKGVDTTSNATLTSEAIINATAKALAGAAP